MGEPWRITVPGRYEYLAEIARFITRVAHEAGLTDDAAFHVEMAVDEACSNIMEHAYADHSGVIDLTCTCPEAGCLEVVIHDVGRPFNPESVPIPNVSLPSLDEVTGGGLGLYFMRKLMDEVRFEFVPGQGNTLYMTKSSPSQSSR